jgi:hypothetical protein
MRNPCLNEDLSDSAQDFSVTREILRRKCATVASIHRFSPPSRSLPQHFGNWLFRKKGFPDLIDLSERDSLRHWYSDFIYRRKQNQLPKHRISRVKSRRWIMAKALKLTYCRLYTKHSFWKQWRPDMSLLQACALRKFHWATEEDICRNRVAPISRLSFTEAPQYLHQRSRTIHVLHTVLRVHA